MELLLPKNIESKILEDYLSYQNLFVEFQSKFLTSMYTRYQCVEKGNLVLYYAKQTQQDILRQKDYNLNFNISYEKFWENHNKINPKRNSVNKVAQDILLPKETTRRKILQLIKQKVLNKKNENIGWLPSEQYKLNYNLVIDQEMNDVAKLIGYICRKINLPIPKEELVKELREKFSFYWFHYLNTQLKYLKLWSKQVNDLELVLIFLQVAHLFTSKAKEKNLSHKNLFDNPSLIKDYVNASISATSIFEITGIPRATCVRKLETLVGLKMILQDNITKRYYLIPKAIEDNLVSRNATEKVVKLFSEFYFICIRAIKTKT